MAQVIKIKRSDNNNSPGSLAQGELAYSSSSNKLFIGNPGTGDVTTIGGKLFVNMLDHTAGTLTANSAIIVDGQSKIDQLLVDNLGFGVSDNNTITSTNTNGNIVITPNGDGNIVLDGATWPNSGETADYYLKTNGSGTLSWAAIPSGVINLTDNQSTPNTDQYTTGETLTFAGGTGLTATVSDNQVEFKITDSGVGSTQLNTGAVTTAKIANDAVNGTKIADDSIDSEHIVDGSVDNVHLANDGITVSDGTNSNEVQLGDTLTVSGGTGITSTHSADQIEISITNGGVDTAQLATSAVETAKINDGAVTNAKIADSTIANGKLVNSSLTLGSTTVSLGGTATTVGGLTKVTSTEFIGDLGKDDASGTDTAGTNLTIQGGAGTGAGAGGSVIIQVADGTSSGSSVNSHATAVTIADDKTMTAAGNVVISGNLTVSGTTTTVNSETINLADNILLINSNYSGNSATENGGLEVNRDSTTGGNAKLLWNETSDKWQAGLGNSMYNLLTTNNFETEITTIDGGSFNT